MCHWHGKKAQVYFSPNWERKARMITLTSFQLLFTTVDIVHIVDIVDIAYSAYSALEERIC